MVQTKSVGQNCIYIDRYGNQLEATVNKAFDNGLCTLVDINGKLHHLVPPRNQNSGAQDLGYYI